MTAANPFDFDDAAPVPPPLPNPARPRTATLWRQPWFIVGAVLLGCFLVFLIVTMSRSAYRDHEHRTYGAPLTGEWVYDGPPYHETSKEARVVLAFVTLGLANILEAVTQPTYNYPGWSMELQADGVVRVRGGVVGRWRATGHDGSWTHVAGEKGLLWIDWDTSPEWQFQPQANGRMLWKPTPDAAPVPLRKKK